LKKAELSVFKTVFVPNLIYDQLIICLG